ncbi:MAG TPA: hypothetical protein VHM92_04245 [Allosphingosinicella sp.]|nr:hypothetical protein [Allosphingosinicella sp.]
MKLAGWFLLGLAALIIVLALQLDTNAATYVASAAGDGTMQATRAPSLPLLQRQMMLFQLGLAAFVAGVLLQVGSELTTRLGGGAWREEGSAPSAPQRRPAGRGELIAGAVMVGVILLILLVVAMSGRGNETATVNAALPPELMNDADASLVDGGSRPERVQRNEARAPKASEPAPPGDVSAADTSPSGNTTQPPPPPASNSAAPDTANRIGA